MAEQEVNAINHLLEVEQNAQIMTQTAQIDADKKIAAAKAEADSQFKVQYDRIVEQKESEYRNETARILEESEKKIKEYKSEILSAETDTEAFNELLNKVLL